MSRFASYDGTEIAVRAACFARGSFDPARFTAAINSFLGEGDG